MAIEQGKLCEKSEVWVKNPGPSRNYETLHDYVASEGDTHALERLKT